MSSEGSFGGRGSSQEDSQGLRVSGRPGEKLEEAGGVEDTEDFDRKLLMMGKLEITGASSSEGMESVGAAHCI